nr:putative tRNA pseudouridine synthase Pus10 isoform X2 [Ipomoea batatas]
MESTFHIRLTYSGSLQQQSADKRNVGNKRRKTDSTQSVDIHKVEGEAFTRTSSLNSQKDCFDYVKHLIEKVIQPCHLTTHCYRNPIYIGGRYLKYSRNVSQTRWVIDDERMGEASVEEILGGCILPLCQGDGYKFHAAGREDIDVRMLGTGRPFLVEIQNARQVPSEGLIKDIEIKINSLENQLVKVRNLKSLGSQGWAMINEGEAEKQKQYAALVWISRDVNNDDLQTISSVKDMKIIQKTPIRVLHRRSPLEREKIIHWMKLERIEGSSQYFLLHLCTQAGTYIKEFVHGDLGRTHPSIGSMLGCRAEILQLDVTDVKMDCF